MNIIRCTLILIVAYNSILMAYCGNPDKVNMPLIYSCNPSAVDAQEIRSRLFDKHPAIEYCCILYYGETPFLLQVRESFNGDFIMAIKALKKSEYVEEKQFIIIFKDNKFENNSKDPFFKFYPTELCRNLGVPIGFELNQFTLERNKKNAIVDIYCMNKCVATAIKAKSCQLFSFISINNDYCYYGSHSGGIGGVITLYFKRNIHYDHDLKSLLSSSTIDCDNYPEILSKNEGEWNKTVSQMRVWLKAKPVESTKSTGVLGIHGESEEKEIKMP